MSYASIEEIRSAGRRITAIREATNVEINAWAAEANAIIHSFCNQSFVYEEDVDKVLTLYRGDNLDFSSRLRAYANLPSVLNGPFTVTVDGDEISDYFYTYNAESLVLYYDWSDPYSEPNQITVRGTWGYASTPEAVKIVFLRLVMRLAIRSSEEDMIHLNSGYTNEVTGDGYSYNLSNGTLRNLLRPEDFVLLWPYVNHGVVIA